jgi:hypothetical protein
MGKLFTVGDVDGGGLKPLVQFLELGAHGHAQLGIEVGQRLIKQKDLRVAHDGAAHGDALSLSARELTRVEGDVYHWGSLMAGALLGSVPVAVMYSFFVEYYVAGMTGAVKE